MSYAILRTEKINTRGVMGVKYLHNTRQRTTPNADNSKTQFNQELTENNTISYLDLLDKRIGELEYYTNHNIRKNAVLGVEIMLTYSEDATLNLTEWKQDNLKWLQDTFGKENIISAILHMDEGTPHIHALFLPIRDGKLNCKSYLGGKEKLRALQTSYAIAMKKHGLERGIEGSQIKHEKVQRFYGAIKQASENELPEVQKQKHFLKEKEETAKEYKTRINELYQAMNLQLLENKKEIQSLKKISSSQEKKIQELKNKSNKWKLLEKKIQLLAKTDHSKAKKLQIEINELLNYTPEKKQTHKKENTKDASENQSIKREM